MSPTGLIIALKIIQFTNRAGDSVRHHQHPGDRRPLRRPGLLDRGGGGGTGARQDANAGRGQRQNQPLAEKKSMGY